MSKIQQRDIRRHNLQKRIMQKGRSMVEMLGVLVIVGVLSIGGIVGMQYAMQIYKENETVNAFSVATAGARTANLMQNYIYSCDGHYPCVVDPKQVISTHYKMTLEDFATAVNAPVQVRIEDTNGYTVRIRGISKEICEEIKHGSWGETCAGIDTHGQNKTYRGSAECVSLKNLDCDKFDNAENGLTRRSAWQEYFEKNPIETVKWESALQYSALVLYYSESAGESEYYGTDEDFEYSPDPEPDPDSGDPGDEREDPSDSDPQDDPDASCDLTSASCCSESGYTYINNTCCATVGSDSPGMNAISGNEDSNCQISEDCEGRYEPKECCPYIWVESTNACCRVVSENGIDAEGNPSDKCKEDPGDCNEETGVSSAEGKQTHVCCSHVSNGRWVSSGNGEGVCCIGATKAGEAGQANASCCTSMTDNNTTYEMEGTICCIKGSSQNSDGTRTKECCEHSDGSWRNGSWCCASWASGAMCRRPAN